VISLLREESPIRKDRRRACLEICSGSAS